MTLLSTACQGGVIILGSTVPARPAEYPVVFALMHFNPAQHCGWPTTRRWQVV